MSDRNASASAFGWDFQTNSAILLMLENIKDALLKTYFAPIRDITGGCCREILPEIPSRY